MTNSDSVDDPFLAQVEGGLSGRRLVDSAFGELRILIDGSFLKPGGGGRLHVRVFWTSGIGH
jgi:hypothetical protein